jgi:hypothetical protein
MNILIHEFDGTDEHSREGVLRVIQDTNHNGKPPVAWIMDWQDGILQARPVYTYKFQASASARICIGNDTALDYICDQLEVEE